MVPNRGARELPASARCLPAMGGMGEAWGPAAPSGCPQHLCGHFALAAMLGEQAGWERGTGCSRVCGGCVCVSPLLPGESSARHSPGCWRQRAPRRQPLIGHHRRGGLPASPCRGPAALSPPWGHLPPAGRGPGFLRDRGISHHHHHHRHRLGGWLGGKVQRAPPAPRGPLRTPPPLPVRGLCWGGEGGNEGGWRGEGGTEAASPAARPHVARPGPRAPIRRRPGGAGLSPSPPRV